LQLVKNKERKIFICMLFMMIFISKMIISVAPAFLSLNNKTVNAVIMQLELENKNDKDDPEKESSKDKKFFDEDCQHVHHPVQLPVLVEINTLHNHENALYQPDHHPSVSTPPPDAILV
jgi:hypothetical protein